MIDYVITQTGKSLSSEKIKLNKYDNKVSRLVFNLDGTIPGNLLFLAMKNPVTGEYFYSPVTDNAVVIGNSVTRYPGRWDCILLATEDYELDVTGDIDEERLTYVSDELRRVVVIDNFLDDDAYIGTLSYPAMDTALEKFAHEFRDLYDLVQQVGDDVGLCQNFKNQSEDILVQMQGLLTNMTAMYNNYMTSMEVAYSNYIRRIQNGGA